VSTAIDTLTGNILRLDSLHSKSLSDLPDDPNAQATVRQIDSLMADTSRLVNGIKGSVKGLENRARAARGDMQRSMVSQTESLKKKFRDAINKFQLVEKNYRDRTHARMERQMRIGIELHKRER
jgi:syntaxin 1B/2/3